jgi:hypothetical protein
VVNIGRRHQAHRADIADRMQEWFETGAADEFTIIPAVRPDGIDDFVELVVPELQQRALFRTERGARKSRPPAPGQPLHRRASRRHLDAAKWAEVEGTADFVCPLRLGGVRPLPKAAQCAPKPLRRMN